MNQFGIENYFYFSSRKRDGKLLLFVKTEIYEQIAEWKFLILITNMKIIWCVTMFIFFIRWNIHILSFHFNLFHYNENRSNKHKNVKQRNHKIHYKSVCTHQIIYICFSIFIFFFIFFILFRWHSVCACQHFDKIFSNQNSHRMDKSGKCFP